MRVKGSGDAKICVLGLSHKTSPVEVREKLAFDRESLSFSLERLVSHPSISEGVILSTCNRVEVYFVSDSVPSGKEAAMEVLLRGESVDRSFFYFLHGREAVRHLFLVASGLDSMVLGEPQILGQVKDAYREAVSRGTTSTILNKLFHWAFRTAKLVRRGTRIGESAVSVSYAAFQLAKDIFDRFDDKTLLMVGAGEMVELALKHFVSHGVGNVLITNRTFKRAVELSQEFSGEPIPFEVFKDYLYRADIVLSCTGSSRPILSKKDFEYAMRKRKGRYMFVIDIAVPRDVSPEVSQIDGVYLFDIDDLEDVVEKNLGERKKEAVKAERIVDDEVEKFMGWLAELETVPVIVRVKDFFEKVRKEELEEALSKLGDGISGEKLSVVDKLTEAICNKIFHRVAVSLKKGDPSIRKAVERIFLGEQDESKTWNEKK